MKLKEQGKRTNFHLQYKETINTLTDKLNASSYTCYKSLEKGVTVKGNQKASWKHNLIS